MLVHVTTDLTTTNIMIQTKGTKGGLFFMSVHLENTNFHAHGLDMIFLFFFISVHLEDTKFYILRWHASLLSENYYQRMLIPRKQRTNSDIIAGVQFTFHQI